MLTNLSPITISSRETDLLRQLEELSARSGSHSPSLSTMQKAIPEIVINIDACYLSNPLATDLFWSYFNADI
ncbi:MAG: histidinol-phosphate aminotransferase family protein, partial [Dehalococcoidia bacterium]